MEAMRRYSVGILLGLLCVGCSTGISPFGESHHEWVKGGRANGIGNTPQFSSNFLKSGTIILSRKMPESNAPVSDLSKQHLMSPLIGYIPPTKGFLPASNEAWMEIDSASKTLVVFQGDRILAQAQAEGNIDMPKGTVVALQQKQERPVWYATDEYYTRRELTPPPAGARERFLRGALGSKVLYPTATLPIHSAPLWSDDIGGLRVERAQLTALFNALPVGASIVVK